MMKPFIVISPAQSAVLLSAYHTLDEIVSSLEKHNAEYLSCCACLTATRDELYHALIEDDTVLWDGDAVVMNKGE